MKYLTIAAVATILLAFTACGSNDQEADTHMESNTHMEENMHSDDQSMYSDQTADLKSEKRWVRTVPIDVNAIDENGDGYVYQDHMDWNVIADEEGRCPECGMYLKKTSIEDTKANLRENGFKVK
jgi:uncharacterized protein with PIN domain